MISPIYYFFSLLGVGIVAILVLVFAGPEYLAFVNIIILAVLVVVTSQYADQTTKMAREMEKQRLDSARPIIDIVWKHGLERTQKNNSLAILEAKKEAKAEIQPWTPEDHRCRIHNIGLGPALEVCSLTHDRQANIMKTRLFGTIAQGAVYIEDPIVDWPISPLEIDNRYFLKVYYKDIYKRCFESSREVFSDKLDLGHLDTREIPEEEFPK